MLRLTAIFVAAVALATTAVFALDNGEALIPDRGWSTWCTFGPVGSDYCSEQGIKSVIDTITRNGMSKLGYDTVMMDDCWAATYRTANGSLTWDPERFPSGMPNLIAYAHANGMKMVLYTSVGNYTCSSGGRPGQVPGSYGHYQQDVDTMISWGADGIKADFCKVQNKFEVGGDLYKNFSRAVMNRNSTHPTLLHGVGAVMVLWGETPKYVNAWRATPDHHDSWKNTLENLAIRIIHIEPHGRPGAWAFMDVLMTGGGGCHDSKNNSNHCPGMTNTQYLSEFSLWNVLQSPLFPCTDVRNMTAIMKRILFNKLFLDINTDTRTPPGEFIGGDSKNCPLIGKLTCSFWLRRLADGSVFLVLFNAQETSTLIEFDFAENAKHLPGGAWGKDTTVSVTDMWNPQFSAVPPHVLGADANAPEMTYMPARGFGTTATGKFQAVVDASGVASVLLKPVA